MYAWFFKFFVGGMYRKCSADSCLRSAWQCIFMHEHASQGRDGFFEKSAAVPSYDNMGIICIDAQGSRIIVSPGKIWACYNSQKP